MKKLFAVFALLAISGISTLAQDRGGEGTPLFDVNAGYTFLRFQNPPVAQPPSNTNYNGFNAGGDFNFTDWLGLALAVDGTYNTSQGVQTSIYTYQAGPRIYPVRHHKLSPYVLGLIGVGTFHFPTTVAPTETKLSFEIGGGAEYTVWKSVALRGELDYQWTQFLHGESVIATLPANNQNNLKASVGVVFRFGKK
ncbi:MAG: outer membrane beta-barrel protein [Candidatus Acidiferrales bacterium]